MRSKDLYGNWLLLRFYTESLVRLHRLPKWMRFIMKIINDNLT